MAVKVLRPELAAVIGAERFLAERKVVSGELRGDLRAQGREITDLEPSDPSGFVANAAMPGAWW